MNFSLIIPCYNEIKKIPILIHKYREFLKSKNNELILVDNGSTDRTKYYFNKIKKKNIKKIYIKKNIGFGNGIKKGLSKAKGEFLIYSHADLEVDPNDIGRAIKILVKKKYIKRIFIKGNRINKKKNYWTLSDRFFSYSLTIFSSILFLKKLEDIHAQPVMFHKSLLRKMKYLPNDFSIDLAIYVYAKIEKLFIVRFPVNFNKKKRIYGQGSSDSLYKKIKGSLEQLFVQ